MTELEVIKACADIAKAIGKMPIEKQKAIIEGVYDALSDFEGKPRMEWKK